MLLLLAGTAWGVGRAVLRDEPAPRVLGHYPPDGAEDVSPRARLDVVLNGSLSGVADRLRFSLVDAHGEAVPGAVHLDPAMRGVEFEPREPLASGRHRAVVEVPGVVEPVEWSFTVPSRAPLTRGPGGPVLLALDAEDPYDDFLAEVLRAEGLTAFTTVDVAGLDPGVLRRHEAVLLSRTPPGPAADALAGWVRRGGHAVLFRPRGALARLAGHVPAGRAPVPDGRVSTGQPAWAAAHPLHGPADVVRVGRGAEVVAQVLPGAGAGARAVPGVTVRRLGERGGRVTAFTWDLARAVVLTRQGNPAWAGREHDGHPPLRPNELFEAPPGEGEDWVDPGTAEVPHADEQMRLLSRQLVEASADAGRPLPRWWYLPRDHAAAVVLAADDHGVEDGTLAHFRRLVSGDPPGCVVARWECARGTSWIYPEAELTPAEADELVAAGFDLGAHVTTSCQNWSPRSLDLAYARGLRAFRARFPALPAQRGSRLHCVVTSDPLTQPRVERAWGIRLDMNYYRWPPEWVDRREGFMTGSGLPMRFSDLDGGLLDVHQQETHLVDEVFHGDADALRRLVSRARGPQGWVGAFGTHVDFTDSFADDLVSVARGLRVPVVSAEQLLAWTDARAATTYGHPQRDDRHVHFRVRGPSAAEVGGPGMLRAMMPLRTRDGVVRRVLHHGKDLPHDVREVQGLEYAVFDAVPGGYTVRYGPPARAG